MLQWLRRMGAPQAPAEETVLSEAVPHAEIQWRSNTSMPIPDWSRQPWPEADGDVCEAIDFLEYYARGAIELDATTAFWITGGNDAQVMSDTQLTALLEGQPEEIQEEVLRINDAARDRSLQVALLVPVLAAALGLVNGFRMMATLPSPRRRAKTSCSLKPLITRSGTAGLAAPVSMRRRLRYERMWLWYQLMSLSMISPVRGSLVLGPTALRTVLATQRTTE